MLVCPCFNHYVTMHFLVTTISFNQSVYIVNERDGQVNPVLVLSNVSSIYLTIQVLVTDLNASELYIHTCSCVIQV